MPSIYANYNSIVFSVNFDQTIKQLKNVYYVDGSTTKSITLTTSTLTFDESLEIRKFLPIVTANLPYHPDVINTTYDENNLDFNYIHVNYAQNADASEVYTTLGGFYFKNSLTGTDDVLHDKLNGIGYYAKAPEVFFHQFIYSSIIN